MMESMMKLPDDVFRQELLPFLIVRDIIKLVKACVNHKYRPQLLSKITGVILLGDRDKSMEASLFKWLGMRRIYLINMNLDFEDDNTFSSIIENDYIDQFRYTQHVVMSGLIRDDMAIFIMSRCPCLLSIVISSIDDEFSADPQVTDYTLQWIAEHCTGLQSLSLGYCGEITDAGLITISEHCSYLESLMIISSWITDASIISISTHCTGLQSLNLEYCGQITDASIISISTLCTGLKYIDLGSSEQITDASILSLSTHCTGLQSLNLEWGNQISDASIISISTHCTGLRSLNLGWCSQITDAAIISISTNCAGLQSLNLYRCSQITDASIISVSTNCAGLQSLNLYRCHQITDASIISISKNCKGLKRLNVLESNITDASLIAMAKNSTGLQYLNSGGCNGLSSYKLRRDVFNSVSELRAVLLSIYPSLPI